MELLNKETSYVSWGEFLALVYHDVFDYPLTGDELRRWEMRDGRLDVRSENTCLVETTGEFYHLAGRRNTVLLRKSREKITEEKIDKARYAVKFISKIPTVKFVGITGSLAMNNAEKDSDIDLIVVTHVDCLWITRIFVYGVLKLYGLKIRRPGRVGDISNSLCLNLWLDENNLSVPEGMRNLYTAHEVFQIVPLVNKNNTFEKFLAKNIWARDFWPRGKSGFMIYDLGIKKRNNLTLSLVRLFEPIAYRFQLWRMRSRRTRETIEPGRAFFHPIDWGEYVMREFTHRVDKWQEQTLTNYTYGYRVRI